MEGYTTEQPLSIGIESRKISRRTALRLAAVTAGAIAGDQVFNKLSEGIILKEYPFSVEDKYVGDIELLSSTIFGPEGGTLSKSGNTLIFEPSSDPDENFFIPHETYDYVHRANRAGVIRRAYGEGANLIDIDINNELGFLYADHGTVVPTELKIGRRVFTLHFPGVIDINERGLTLGGPNMTYRSAVELVAQLSKDGRRAAVSAEFKRGECGPDELYQIFEIHQENGVSLQLHSPHPEQLMTAGDTLAAYYSA